MSGRACELTNRLSSILICISYFSSGGTKAALPSMHCTSLLLGCSGQILRTAESLPKAAISLERGHAYTHRHTCLISSRVRLAPLSTTANSPMGLCQCFRRLGNQPCLCEPDPPFVGNPPPIMPSSSSWGVMLTAFGSLGWCWLHIGLRI
jgi:hypothetical protein